MAPLGRAPDGEPKTPGITLGDMEGAETSPARSIAEETAAKIQEELDRERDQIVNGMAQTD